MDAILEGDDYPSTGESHALDGGAEFKSDDGLAFGIVPYDHLRIEKSVTKGGELSLREQRTGALPTLF